MIISGFAGIGKTYLGNKYDNVIDLESSDYKWLYQENVNDLDKEKLKGRTDRIFNPMWPDNYINALLEADNIYDIVLISQGIDVLSELRLRKIPFLVVIPELGLKEEYLERCRNRGNNEVFIGFIEEYYEYLIKKLMNRNDSKIILKSGEYLEDVLISHGYLLVKKENYNEK